MPRFRKMIKSFLFEESYRRDMVDLNSGVRLNPETNRLELTPIGGGSYPTTLDLFARTRLTTPEAVRKWTGFFVILNNVKISGNVVTDVRFKISDGISDYYWNTGANAWVVAAPNNWNTEQEVADNIDKWLNQSIQILINLSTQNESVTPYVNEVRLLYETDLVFLEDYVVRSFKEDLLENVRPISVIAFDSSGETQKDLSVIKTPYDIVGIDAIYNNTADEKHFSPLSGVTFNSTTKTVFFPTQPSGNRIEIRFIWSPYVVLTQSQDYTEVRKIPVVVFDDVSIENESVIRNRPYVINKGTGNGFVFEEGFQADIRIPLRIITSSRRDLDILSDELKRYFANTTFLRSRGQDENYTYRVSETFNDNSVLSQKELYTGRLTVFIEKAVFYSEDAKPITGVKRFSVTGGNITIEVTN